MTNFVQLYKSTDLNAPVLTGQVGALITVLNKCLVDGYATASVTSLTESGTNYTAVLAVANSTLVVGNWITFAGASPGGANIAMKINAITDPTHIVCTGPGGLGAITGTITYAKSPLGWAKAFAAGTNAQVYRSPDTNSDRFYLQAVDNAATAGGAKEAQIYGAEVMSADQTVTSGQFPTTVQYANGLCLRKSTTADATARAWALIGDDKTFYFIPTTGDASVFNPMGFGHFLSAKAGDAYKTFIGGGAAFNIASHISGLAKLGVLTVVPTTLDGLFVARSYSQLGSAVPASLNARSPGGAIGQGNLAQITYPNGSDNGLYTDAILVIDALGNIRGRMPGWIAPLHAAPLSNYDIATGVTGLSGVTLTALSVSYSATVGQVFVDTFGPWA